MSTANDSKGSAGMKSDASTAGCERREEGTSKRSRVGSSGESERSNNNAKAPAPAPAPEPALLEGIPIDIWAKAADLLPHEDLVRCSSVSRSFLRDVSPAVSRIMISPDTSSDVLRYFPTKRFPNVRSIYLYNLLSEIGDHAAMCRQVMDEFRDWAIEQGHTRLSMADVQCSTLEQQAEMRQYRVLDDVSFVVPFLTSFPKLEKAFLGGICTCATPEGPPYNTHHCWDGDDVREDLSFIPRAQHDAKYMIQQSQLLKAISCAYYQGRLDENVSIDGLLPDFFSRPREDEENECLWRDIPGNTPQADEDASIDNELSSLPYECCRDICNCFPVEDVFRLEDHQTPCIGMQQRTEIARRRNPSKAKKFLTSALCKALMQCTLPGFRCISYTTSDDTAERIKFLVSQGADVKDPTVRDTVLRCADHISEACMEDKSFRLLTELGIPLDKSDFVIVDLEVVMNSLKGAVRNVQGR